MKVRKNMTPRRSDRAFRLRAKNLIGVMLSLFVLLGVFRIGFIMLVKGDEYRSSAEQNQLYDQEIAAVRGTVYDSNMTPLVTSSSAWILVCDPGEIY